MSRCPIPAGALLVPLLLVVLAVGFRLALRRPGTPASKSPAEPPMDERERAAIRAHAMQTARHQWRTGRTVVNPFAGRPVRSAYWQHALLAAQHDIYIQPRH
jgi:hypothetical protein